MKKWILTVLIVMFLSSVSFATSLSVTWPNNAATDSVTKYNVYMRNNTAGTGFVKGQDIVGTSVTPAYTIANVPDAGYSVRITALNGNGESAFSPVTTTVIDTTPPIKVKQPKVAIVRTWFTSKSLYITWYGNPASDNVAYYRIYVKLNNTDGSGFVKGQGITAQVKYNVLYYYYSLKYSSNYCVRVTAVDGFGNESDFSDPVFCKVRL
jgi:hypothetical protein